MSNARKREEEQPDARQESDEPEAVNLGERSFADQNVAADERSQGQSRRESALSADNRSLGSHDQENSPGLTGTDRGLAPQDDVTPEDPTGAARRAERGR